MACRLNSRHSFRLLIGLSRLRNEFGWRVFWGVRGIKIQTPTPTPVYTWDIKPFVLAIKLDFLYCRNFDYVLEGQKQKQKHNSVQILIWGQDLILIFARYTSHKSMLALFGQNFSTRNLHFCWWNLLNLLFLTWKHMYMSWNIKSNFKDVFLLT